jgi:formylmethanofuran dehydrogenase subunit C
MVLQLELTQSTSIPLELEGITPDVVRELETHEIEKLEIFHGNQKAALAEFFRVQGTASDEEIRFSGDHSGVHWIGAKMKSGRIVAEGNVGRHLGSEMEGGEIEIHGDVGDWVGAELRGGTIRVHGRAGHLVGAAYRGSARGMTGGTIVIDGDAGNEIGHTMRRGMIAIGGATGDLIGFNMLAGTVLAGGPSGIRHGAGMHRGTLVFLSEQRPAMLPTFTYAGRQQPMVMSMLQKELGSLGYQPADLLRGDFDMYHGDLLEGGRGEVMVRVA